MRDQDVNGAVFDDSRSTVESPESRLPRPEHPAAVPAQSDVSARGNVNGMTPPLEVDGSGPSKFIYALGRIEARFPRLAAEKEFAQATGRMDADALTDRQAFHKLLSQPENRYLVRQLCWVFTIEGVETYILVPRNPVDFDLLVESIRPSPRTTDVDIVIGRQGPLAPPELCNGLVVPVVAFDQVYSFDVDSLVKSIPKPKDPEKKISAAQFEQTAEELFQRIMQIADNAGATDEHRALNYVAVRYPAVYAIAADAFGRNQTLRSVDVRPSRLSGARRIVDVVFSYVHRETDVAERYFVRVDVTEEFPFLAAKISPYYVYDQYP